MNRDIYQEPLVSRYTSREMQELFSERFKFTHWRKCWVALAEAQHELGLSAVTAEMVAELKANTENIDYEAAAAKEREIRHDVMAHVFAYGQQCPLAEPIIHLGATSQFVVCNTDLLIQKRALGLVKKSLLKVIANLAEFCARYKDLATLGFTHYQPAQPTTVGKRNTLYLQDLLMDLDYIEQLEGQIKARGAKGTVGTQATFIELFAGDHAKVRELDRLVSEKIGFDQVFAVTGQTYPRKLDMKTSETLAGIGASAHKFAVDLRLLSNLKVQEEPFESKQVGSSAMAYKRNPMRSERMTGLARKLMGLPANFAATAANQWFERTLDDSAIRRMDMAQAFLLTDAILKLYINITNDMVVYPKQIERHLKEELPFMATEKILMACVERGKSRQEMHEVIREHSVAAGSDVKNQGLRNNLLDRLAEDERVPFDYQELNGLIGDYQQFTGRAAVQTEEFLREQVAPVLEKHQHLLGDVDASLTV
ncbi:adenylosuccinate lyase [Desulfobulbus sp.]|uniref:adenylosuccinate lyase n=1 Tax=Desulfobulbus sp. TaxID=895 RepID=UPI0035A07DEF